MATLKFTFDDGSEALAHYGKKGMHWGEWNEETQQKYASNPDLIGDFAKAMSEHAGNQATMNPSGTYKEGKASLATRAQYGAQSVGMRAERAVSDFAKDPGKAMTTAGKWAKAYGLQAGKAAGDLAKEAGRVLSDVSGNAGKAADDLAKQASKNVSKLSRSIGRSASDIAKHASRTFSEVSSNAVESGSQLVDSIFRTKFSKKSKDAARAKTEAREAKRHAQVNAKVRTDRAQKAQARRREQDARERYERKDAQRRAKVNEKYRKEQREQRKQALQAKARKQRAVNEGRARKKTLRDYENERRARKGSAGIKR